MKHRVFCLLLALTLLASMLAAPTSALDSEADVTPTAQECPCGCGKTLDAVTWKSWDVNESGSPSSGHYYLDGNYVQNSQQEIMAGDRVVLDLRGNTITTKGYGRLLLVYGRMHILDTVGGGRFMSKTSGGHYGGVVMVSTNEVNDSLFELCSGTITRDADNQGSRRGGLIHVSETATFRMTGGTLLNGSTVSTSNPDKLEPGGCVAGASTACTIEILGGQIIGGESATHGGNIYNVGTTVLKNCHILGGTSATYGGNICQDGGSLTIENCVIESGVSNASGGGNICVMNNAAFSVKDSTVRNGWSAYHGGNIYMGTSTGIIENTVIEAGVAQNRGNNVYGSTVAAGLTIKDCVLPGDITYVGSGLALTGMVKIGLLNSGLRLYYSDVHSVTDVSGLTEGSEIYVEADHAFTEAGANIAYFYGALRTVLSETEEGLVGAQAASGEQGGCCPHCGEAVIWKEFSLTDSLVQECLLDETGDTDTACTGRHIESGHYYLTGSITDMAQQYIGIYLSGAQASKDVVIDLAGCDISATGRAFYLRPGDSEAGVDQSSLTLLDSYGGGTVTGRGANNQGGGVLYNEGSKLTVYGGTYVYNPVEGRNVTGGGVIRNGDSFTMHGGTLDGSAFTYTDASTDEKTYTYNGGALNTGNGATKRFTMTAGRIIGGTAQSGGAAYFGYNNVVNITGGQLDSGVSDAGSGGNIYVYGSSTYKSGVFNMTGASVRNGSITDDSSGGGNFNIGYGTVNLTDCYIAGGSVVKYGGNISCSSYGPMTFTNCVIEGGTAGRAGNIHTAGTSAITNWVNCLILNGTASTYGGNMNIGHGSNTILGGQILFGTAGTYGGNISNSAGNYSATTSNHLTVQADDAGNAALIAGGTAGTYGGNLYNGGVLDMQAAQLVNGQASTLGQDLYMIKASKQGKLTVGSGVTGKISAAFNSGLYGSEVYGQTIDRTVCDTLNAEIVLEGDYNSALLCAKDGALYVGAIAVIDSNGGYTWFTDTASAVAACDEDSYIKLYIAQDVVLTKDCAVDICGQTVNVSGAYTLYGMDSSGDSFEAPTGKAVLSEETKLVADVTMGGKRYIAASDDTGSTFHRLENKITSVSLRPSADGIYYTGSFGCDETLVDNIASYGVAVSTVNAPGADFMTDADTLYTNFEGNTLQGGASVTGVLISGIMKQEGRNAELNSAYGQMPVFAASYLTLNDGTVILSESVAYSLRDIMTTLDDLIANDPLNYRKLTNPMRDFYAKWEKNGMADWNFKKIITPEEDDVIDILMIGSSFCYYYVEEMCGLAEAAGIEMRVCNVYYSGCKLYQHYNWWINGESNYQFFDTTVENGRVQTNNVSLEWCLAQGQWDVISLQESSSQTRNDPDHLETTRLYYTTLINYLTEQFPAAQMSWHQTWSYQIGYDRNGYQMTSLEQQQTDMESVQAYCMAICEEFGIQRINTGEAWQIVRSDYGYDNLCARLGKGTNHEGDYYHDGDIGGGQYLNACVWFEIITGQSCIGNTYRPVYTYNGEEIPLNSDITYEALQEAAHQAVLDKSTQEAAQ